MINDFLPYVVQTVRLYCDGRHETQTWSFVDADGDHIVVEHGPNHLQLDVGRLSATSDITLRVRDWMLNETEHWWDTRYPIELR